MYCRISTVCIIVTFILFPLCSASQISIGNKLPDIEFKNLLNYKSETLKLSDFRGKLVIIDFWAPSCVPCWKAFPKLDSLQRIFDNKIQIVLVNRDKNDLTTDFLKKVERFIKTPSLPMITSDTILWKWLPEDIYGQVWIDGLGIVRYISQSYNITRENISAFLNGKELGLASRKISYHETLFDKQWEQNVQYYSYISRCIDVNGLRLTNPENESEKESSITNGNCASVVELYQKAYCEREPYQFGFGRPGRTLLLVKDSFPYIRPKKDHDYWFYNHSYYYQLRVPYNRRQDKYKMMREDLDRFFDLEVSVEKRKVKCIALIRTSTKDLIKTKGGGQKDNFSTINVKAKNIVVDSLRYFINKPYSLFSFKLLRQIEIVLNKPFIDETNYAGNIDIIVKGDTLDFLSIEALRNDLKKYDLDLVEKEVVLDVLVIKEKNKSNDKLKVVARGK